MAPQKDYDGEVEDGPLRETELVSAREEILDRARELGHFLEERVRQLAGSHESTTGQE